MKAQYFAIACFVCAITLTQVSPNRLIRKTNKHITKVYNTMQINIDKMMEFERLAQEVQVEAAAQDNAVQLLIDEHLTLEQRRVQALLADAKARQLDADNCHTEFVHGRYFLMFRLNRTVLAQKAEMWSYAGAQHEHFAREIEKLHERTTEAHEDVLACKDVECHEDAWAEMANIDGAAARLTDEITARQVMYMVMRSKFFDNWLRFTRNYIHHAYINDDSLLHDFEECIARERQRQAAATAPSAAPGSRQEL